MIDPALYAGFILATCVLIMIPGPNMALIVANSMAYGARYGLITVAGTTSAMVPQLLLTGLGLSGALAMLGLWFAWLRWAGVAYLLYLGIRQWRAPPLDLSQARAQPRSAMAIYRRALLVSLTNPKTLLFYGAFLPQFISPQRDPAAQMTVLAVTFVTVAVVLDSLWALLAARARFLLGRHGRLRNRISGGLLIGAGLGLALAHRR